MCVDVRELFSSVCTEKEVAIETTIRGITFRETLGVQDGKL